MKKNGTRQPPTREALTQSATNRRPAAHPGHPLTRAKPEERAHPAERKVKHKRRPGGESE
jgi:hypothetical protein